MRMSNNNKLVSAILVAVLVVSSAFLIALFSTNVKHTFAQVAKSAASQAKQVRPQNQTLTTAPRAQVRHFVTTLFRYPSLLVITHVNGSKGGNISANNFPQMVSNTYRTSDGYATVVHFIRGSDFGVTLSMRPGVYSLGDQGNTTNSVNRLYNTTYSGDCHTIRLAGGNTVAFGVIRPGDSPGCIVTKIPLK